MNHLKRLGLTFTLMSVLAVTTFAGETQSPPCAPGETLSPPCTSGMTASAPGQTETPPASNAAVDVTDIAEAVLWALSLF